MSLSSTTTTSIHPPPVSFLPSSTRSPPFSSADGSQTQSITTSFTVTSLTSVMTATTTTSASNSDQGPPGISKSSSLLFGFLVTFLALFVTFMACGFGGRRAMDLRRRRMANNPDLMKSPSKLVKPQLWDVWIEGGDDVMWPTMLPLSASVKRSEKETLESGPDPMPVPAGPQHPPEDYFPAFIAAGGRGLARITATPTYNPAIRRGTRARPPSPLASSNAWSTSPFVIPDVPAWMPFFQSRSRKPTSEPEKEMDEGIEGIQVSVLIAMPTPHRSKAAEADVHEEPVDGCLGEYALGVSAVPWNPSFSDLY